VSSTRRGGKKGRRGLLPRPSARAAEIYRKWMLLSFLLLTLAAFAVPAPPSLAAGTSYATGTVNLALYNGTITEIPNYNYLYSGDANVSGIISITGDYQYVSTVTNNISTSYTSSVGGSSASYKNLTVSAPGETLSRTYVINTTSVASNAAPIYLSGTVTLYYQGDNGTTTMNSTIGFKNPYYVDESVAFYTIFPVSYEKAEYAVVDVVAESSSGAVLTVLTETVANPYTGEVHNVAFAQNIWIGAVALPAFNDTMLGAWVNGTSVLQPTLPIGGLYNIMAMIGLILLSVSIAFSFFSRKHLNQALADVAVGAAIILLFPYIYDHIAILMNYLNAYLIAYPQPYNTFLARLWEIQTNIIFPPNNAGLLTWALTLTILGIAYTVIWIITWIMLFILGTVRILLLAAMLIMFPLSVALRDIRFTSKLGRMIEDTLFGIMLASILSASALATVSWLLTNWNSDNIFVLGGFQPQWVAIAGVLVAILAPTVLAPLTATTYEVTSQAAMAGASVGYMVGTAGAGGAVSGWKAVGAAGGGLKEKLAGAAMGAGVYGGMETTGHILAAPLGLGGDYGPVVNRMRHHAKYVLHGRSDNSSFFNSLASLLGRREEGPERPPAGVG